MKTLEELQREVQVLSDLVKSSDEKLSTLQNENKELSAELESFKEIGSADDIRSALVAGRDTLQKYAAIGSVDEVASLQAELADLKSTAKSVDDIEAKLEKLGIDLNSINFETENEDSLLGRMYKTLAQYAEVGSLAEVNKAVDALTQYAEMGSIANLEDSIATLAQYQEIGSIDEVNRAVDALSQYADMGSIDEVNRAVDALRSYTNIGSISEVERANDYIAQKADEILNQKAVAFAEKVGISGSVAKEVLESHSFDEEAALAYVAQFKAIPAIAEPAIAKVPESSAIVTMSESHYQ